MMHGGKKKGKGIGATKTPAAKTAPDATCPNSGMDKRRDLAKGWTGPAATAPAVKLG